MAYSMDLRRKVLAAIDRGETELSVAARFEIAPRTVRYLKQRRRLTGDVLAGKPGPKGHTKLTDDDLRTLEREVATSPGVTLRELQSKLSVPVVESTVCRALQKLGLSFKKSH